MKLVPLLILSQRCGAQFAKFGSTIIFIIIIQNSFYTQTDSLNGFDRAASLKHASFGTSDEQRNKIAKTSERQFIKNKFFSNKSSIILQDSNSFQETSGFCDNINFENSSISGWNVTGDFKIVTSGNDPFGNFPKVFPGGKYSLQLNDNNLTTKTNFEASASKLFHVTSLNSSLNLHFAMVILNYPHDSASAARFKISLRDSTNHVNLCPKFNCYYVEWPGAVGANNFSTSLTNGINTYGGVFKVTYAPWQTIGIDLTEYIGKDISLKISCDWCIFNVDWAYCYIDADCSGFVTKTVPCINSTLYGPPGFQNYKWFTPSGKTIISKSSSLPYQGVGTYTLFCNQSSNCNEFPFTYLFNVLGEGGNPNFNVEVKPCDLSVKFFALDKTLGLIYNWKWQDSLPRFGSASVRHVFNVPGYHWVDLEVTNKSGCMTSARMTLTLTAAVNVTVYTRDSESKLYGPDDKKKYEVLTNYSFGELNYFWTGENFYETGKYANIGSDGLYFLNAVDPKTGCNDTARINVLLNGWIPNIFTPNNDGINDSFRFRTKKGMKLSIFDRWENLLYESEDVDGVIGWDGQFHGKNCSDGVYFYLIRPISASPKSQHRYGTVTISR